MGAFKSNKNIHSINKFKELPQFLNHYENADFSTQQKAQFIFNLCIALFVTLILIISSSLLIQNTSPEYNGLSLPVIIPEIISIFLILSCLVLLIKGFIEITTHLLLISTIATVWLIMWMDNGDTISRLDSVVFIFCIIAMIPILTNRYKSKILIYVGLNILMLFLFVILNKRQLNLSNAAAIDYVADTTIALIFMGILGYSIFIIHNKIIDRTITDIKKRLVAEEKLKESDEGYRYMFKKNPQPMIIYDIDTLDVIEVNDAATDHYGYSNEEFLSFTLRDIRPAEDIPNLLSEINKINSARSSKGISRHLKKSGELIYVDIAAHPITYKGRNARHLMISDITERIQTEVALAESEKKFREMTDLLPQVIFESDQNGDLTYANKKGYELFGFSERELQNGINILSTISESDRALAIENFKRTLNGEAIQKNQYTALRKNGTTFPIQIFSTAIKDNQSVVGIRGIIIDNTEQTLAEEEIKRNRDQFQSLVSNIPGTTYRCLYDKDWTMLFMSSEIEGLSGYQAKDFTNNSDINYKSIIHLEDIQNVSKEIETAIHELRPWEVEYRITKKDGSIRWAYEKGRAILNDTKEIEYLDGFILDITERKMMDELLRESELRYKTLIETSQDGISLMYLDGTMFFANKRKAEMVHAPSETNLIGANAFNFLTESSRFALEKAMPTILQQGYMDNLEADVTRLDGTTFNAEFNVSVLKDGNGIPIYLMDTMRDITERKTVEEKLKQSEQFRRRVFDSSKIPIVIMDAATYRFIDINTAAINTYGFISYEAALGKTPIDVSAPFQYDGTPSPQKATFYVEQALMNGSVTFEWLHRKVNGELWDAEVHLLSFQSNDATLLQYSLIDITEQKKAIKELTDSELRYRILFENAQIGIYQTTPDGKILTANPALLQMLSFESINELQKRNLETEIVYIDSSRSDFKKLIERDGLVKNFESKWLGKNGETINIIENASAVRNEKGEIIYYDGFVEDITERKKTEKALMESQQLFKSLTQMSPVGIFRTTNSGNTTYVNSKWSELSGLSFDEALEYGWLNAVHPEDREKLSSKWTTDSNSKITSVAEYRFLKPDGRIVWVLGNAIPEIVDNIQIGYIGTITNITDIKQAQDAIAKSEKKFRDLSELLPQTVWESDLNGKITYTNKHGLEAMGRTKDDIENGVNLLSTISPDERERAMINIQKRINGENSIANNTEYTSLRKNGTTFPSQVFLTVIYENQKPIGLRGITIDLTDIKKAEKELIESEEKYRTLMESMNEVVIMDDNEHRILYVNKKFTEKLGYTLDEIIGKVGYKMLHDPEDLKIVDKANSERINKIQSSYELAFKAKDGSKYDFLVSGSPVENAKGEVLGSIGIMMDVTEKKKIEKELEQYRHNLEKLVKIRTEELEVSNEELKTTNEELYFQRKELEAALNDLKDAQNRLIQSEKMASLGVLAAGVAHEINNPLNFIYGGIAGIENYFNENLKEHLDEVSPLIEGIHIGVKRAADIVLSLNHYSRRDDLPSIDCNIHNIIDNCLVMLNNKIKNRIEVKKDYTTFPFSIRCNEGRLHQVFLNIIANSIQAIEDTGTITIFTSIKANKVIISISDTGSGIAADILPKITDPFFTTKDPGKGTGLGLSITYNIIKEYNGVLEFESKIGDGTKATIILPIN